MSLYVDEGRTRARSRSRDRRSRDEPPPERPSYADVREPSYVYPEDDLDDRYQPRRDDPAARGGAVPYPVEGGIDHMLPGGSDLYNYDSHRSSYRASSPNPQAPYRSSRDRVEERTPGAFPGDDEPEPQIYTAEPKESKKDRKERKTREKDEDNGGRRVRYAEPRDERGSDDDKLKFLPQKYSSRPEIRDVRPREDGRGSDGRGSDDDKLKFLPSKYSSGTYEDDRSREKTRDRRDRREPEDDRLRFLPQKYSDKFDDDARSSDREDKGERRRRKKERDEDDLAYGKPAGPSRSERPSSPQTYGSYLSGSQWEDRQSSKYEDNDPRRRPTSPAVDDPRREDPRRSNRDLYSDDPRGSRPNVLTVEPKDRGRDRSTERRRDKSPAPGGLAVDTGRERERSRDRRNSTRDRSPQPPTARMSNLTVDTGRGSNLSLASAPGSPMLESYHGTYQDCSPMPSPLLLPAGDPRDDPRIMEAISPIASDSELDGKKRSRRARFHDPEDTATTLARALKGDGPPDRDAITEVLPSLTHEQVMQLRADYKSLVKTGSQRKGVNIAKHIRARLKDENPNLMKACYAVALGKWESESYWANFWYQGDKTRRELLIESLMGRTNEEIRQIKDSFTDKKYDNSLTKCMKTELKEDKFKKAVLMVLEERRMDDYDPYGRRLPLDYKLVDQDVDDLRKAIKSDKGGESLMISIIVQRSDNHLREVLKEYDHAFRSNFARDSLKKSGNLVVSPATHTFQPSSMCYCDLTNKQGEVLAHILNGIINRPVRDALLLHHALTTSKKDELRHELLTSRLVRLHWDAVHMSAVRKAYRERYGKELQHVVREATSGQWGVFCEELCIARVPTEIRKYEKPSRR